MSKFENIKFEKDGVVICIDGEGVSITGQVINLSSIKKPSLDEDNKGLLPLRSDLVGKV